MIRLLALLSLLALPAQADVTVTLDMAFAEDVGATPEARVQVTDLLTGATVTTTEADGDPGHRLVSFVLPESAFPGPYARLRLAVDDLHLPSDDSKADQPIVFAFEMILRRDLITDAVNIALPVVTSSRKGAVKPGMEMPQIAEEVPGRFFEGLQWASLYTASADAVAASPESFAVQRLIVRSLADFALALSDNHAAPVTLIPSEELGKSIKLYWPQGSEGRMKHLRAYQEARTSLWLELAGVQDLLSKARRSGVEGPKYCDQAKKLLAFFDTYRPLDSELGLVDLVFPNPGTLQGYLDGRALDVKYSCTRYSF